MASLVENEEQEPRLEYPFLNKDWDTTLEKSMWLLDKVVVEDRVPFENWLCAKYKDDLQSGIKALGILRYRDLKLNKGDRSLFQIWPDIKRLLLDYDVFKIALLEREISLSSALAEVVMNDEEHKWTPAEIEEQLLYRTKKERTTELRREGYEERLRARERAQSYGGMNG